MLTWANQKLDFRRKSEEIMENYTKLRRYMKRKIDLVIDPAERFCSAAWISTVDKIKGRGGAGVLEPET